MEASEFGTDAVEDGADVFPDVLVGDTESGVSCETEDTVTFDVAILLRVVDRTVNFDDESASRTTEVSNEK